VAHPAAWVAPFSRLIFCCPGRAAIARWIAARETLPVPRAARHRPKGRLQAVDAAQAAAGAADMLRRRVCSATMRWLAISRRTSKPRPPVLRSISSTSMS